MQRTCRDARRLAGWLRRAVVQVFASTRDRSRRGDNRLATVHYSVVASVSAPQLMGFVCCLAIVAWFAKGLPVVRVPEEFLVTTVRRDVVDDRGGDVTIVLCTNHAKGIRAQETRASIAPASIVASLCGVGSIESLDAWLARLRAAELLGSCGSLWHRCYAEAGTGRDGLGRDTPRSSSVSFMSRSSATSWSLRVRSWMRRSGSCSNTAAGPNGGFFLLKKNRAATQMATTIRVNIN